jgi:hypothetical protein
MIEGRSLPIKKRWLVVLAMATIGVPIYFYQKHRAEPVHRELDQEFGRITPAPNSLSIDHESTYKAGTSLVQTEYTTSMSFTRVRAHYKSELERNGWHFHSEGTIEHVGVQSNVQEVVFCKGAYVARVSYADHGSSDSIFWLALSWGLPGCN